MKRLTRPTRGRIIAGVAISVAQFLNVNVMLVRALWVVLTFVSGIFPGVALYLLGWLFIPSESKVHRTART